MRIRTSAVAGLCLVVAAGGIGAARVPTAEPAAGICIPILMHCGTTPSPSPGPTPTPSQKPILPGLPLPGLPESGDGAAGTSQEQNGGLPPIPLLSSPDPSAPVMTLPAAQLGGDSISFSGLQGIGLVTVPLADGSRTTVIRLAADDIVITGFVLDVRRATGPALVSNSSRMELKGHVVVYVDSVTASLLDGTLLTLGANTPTPAQELPPQLLRVNLGLVGVTADSISFADSHQQIHE